MKLNELNSTVHLPSYDRNSLKAKIIHLGLGAFHRGHQAFLHHQLLEKSAADGIQNDWGICSINLFGGLDVVENLSRQNHLYTVLEKSNNNHATLVGSIIESMQVDRDGIAAIINKLSEPQVKIITLTITEKGYCTLPGGHAIDPNNPLICHDLAHPEQPQSAPAILYQALKKRMQLNLEPITLLSCDNMPENGDALKHAVLGFTQLVDADFIPWIEKNISFPSSMVDRIVPAITPETLADITAYIGTEDPCGIATEPFIQWVIEDNFVAGRPAWEKVAGVQLVDNVIPFEEMKLRMLNGSHSFLAYLGYLGGFEHISDCMANPDYKTACERLMRQEQAITLTTKGIDLNKYAQTLIERFENTSLKHRTWQIAMDGTQKIPQRFLASIKWHIAHNKNYTLLALGVAGWMRYISGTDDAGNAIDVKDPMIDVLKQTCATSAEGAERVKALLNLEMIFGTELPKNNVFVEKVTHAYESLLTKGAKITVSDYLSI